MPAWMTGGVQPPAAAPSGSDRGVGEAGPSGGAKITSVEDALAILEQFGKVGGMQRDGIA